jgi:hypothetical protein
MACHFSKLERPPISWTIDMSKTLCVLTLWALLSSCLGQLCDSDSVGWQLLLQHDRVGGGFAENQLNVNEDSLDDSERYSQPLFANLEQLRSNAVRSADGSFYFRLRWPDLCNDPFYTCDDVNVDFIVWSQTSNPLLNATVAGRQYTLLMTRSSIPTGCHLQVFSS